jgi:hypothetical protein
MKKILLFSILILVSVISFSCTADDVENTANSTAKLKTTVQPTKVQANYEEGPGDDTVPVKPPK